MGQSPRIREINTLIRKMGRSDSPVLLLGETGTGKEIVARAIHQAAGQGPFVPIDCSLLGPLLESDLFGHARGAFTGAVANKPGLLEVAEGGTAFFDEIGELPPETQAKLLRVLQEKEFRALGAIVGHKARFRVIAATNRDLALEVDRGRFRRETASIEQTRELVGRGVAQGIHHEHGLTHRRVESIKHAEERRDRHRHGEDWDRFDRAERERRGGGKEAHAGDHEKPLGAGDGLDPRAPCHPRARREHDVTERPQCI